MDLLLAAAPDRVLHTFLVAEVRLPGQQQRHVCVGRLDAAHHRELVGFRAPPQHVPDEHAQGYTGAAGMPANASRIQAWVSHMALRYDRRTAVIGPFPLTTRQNSSQSGWDQIHSPASAS